MVVNIKGIMKKGTRPEPNWKKVKFNEPYKKATDKFREMVLNHPDFDPTSFFQFSIFMLNQGPEQPVIMPHYSPSTTCQVAHPGKLNSLAPNLPHPNHEYYK